MAQSDNTLLWVGLGVAAFLLWRRSQTQQPQSVVVVTQPPQLQPPQVQPPAPGDVIAAQPGPVYHYGRDTIDPATYPLKRKPPVSYAPITGYAEPVVDYYVPESNM